MLRQVIELINSKMMKKSNAFKNHVEKNSQIIIKIKKKKHNQIIKIIVITEVIKTKKIKIRNKLIKIISLIKKIIRIINSSNVKIS